MITAKDCSELVSESMYSHIKKYLDVIEPMIISAAKAGQNEIKLDLILNDKKEYAVLYNYLIANGYIVVPNPNDINWYEYKDDRNITLATVAQFRLTIKWPLPNYFVL